MPCLILSGSSYSNTVSPCAVMSKLPCTESNYLYIMLVIIVLTSGLIFEIHRFPVWFQSAQADTKQWLFVSALWLLRIPRQMSLSFRTIKPRENNAAQALTWQLLRNIIVQISIYAESWMATFAWGCLSEQTSTHFPLSVWVQIWFSFGPDPAQPTRNTLSLLRISIREQTMVFPAP